jgi:UDP:flavonoid glycosyltransferase YjiC (YdhE family)
MVLAAGPRIDPASLSVPAGVEVRGYVPRLDHHLAACDLAVVQGGLATTMELAAAGRPFLYVPLARHFEQQIHVAHRLDRYGVGHRVAFDEASPSRIADVIANELVRPVTAAPIPRDGAARAAAMIAELL